jgi:crotonobetainyl-CoA:carnitine CoA-transferase CaiB-like acyl-CoA transferase
VTPPPTFGQHTAQVLRDLLGYSDADIAALRDSGVIDRKK